MDWLARHGLRSATVGVVSLMLRRLTQGFGQGIVDTMRVVSMTLGETRLVSESLKVFPEELLRVPL